MLLKGKKGITKGKVKKNKHTQNFGFSVNRSHFTSESESFSTAKYLDTHEDARGVSSVNVVPLDERR